jgi:hypothetical protein
MKPVSAIPAPKLADVRLEDLKNTDWLLELYGQAVARGLVGTNEADRLRFIAAAEHALAIATNPAALFVWLVLNGAWRFITQAAEDRANARIKAHLRGPEPASVASPPRVLTVATPLPTSSPPKMSAQPTPLTNQPTPIPNTVSGRIYRGQTAGGNVPGKHIQDPGLSEDARIVKAIREATIRAGIFRDPWPAFQARYPAWDRSRWDRAMGELGLM